MAGLRSRLRLRTRLVDFLIGPKEVMANEIIDGFFSPSESKFLYQSILFSRPERILEIGHFLGKSTAAICLAIKQSGKQCVFNSYDLPFQSRDEFIAYYRDLHQKPIVINSLVEKLFASGMTSSQLAEQNLRRIDVHKFVNLFQADFRIDESIYDYIFCDAMHDEFEITQLLGAICHRSKPGTLWAFHDMSSMNTRLVLEGSPSKFLAQQDSLAIFQYLGDQAS